MQNPLGRLSRRKFILLVLATISLIFSYLLMAAPVANAADATWESGSLMYEGKEYMVAESSDIPNDVGIPANSQVYTYIGGVRLGQGEEMEAIYFPAGSSLETLDSARFVSFIQSQDGSVSDVSDPTTITVDTTTAAQANESSEEDIESGVSSCKIDGLGWIICPLTTLLAKGMDWVYGVIDGFLIVRPLQTTAQDNVMMRSWSVMRNLANIVFVIGFLIIIYSQLTSMGISNYGLKKMLPRLVVAAILVNVSYWICAIAIDLSNIAGISLQQVFIDMRNVVLGTGTNSWDLVSWESVAGFVLSGGAIGGAVAVGGVMTLGALGAAGVGAFYLLLPILMGAFISVLVVLLILAARQAILTILVVIAPLAMVAYLLPNTEKWFEKWRDLFINMLVLFPAFSLIFGGAQLAGILIIQNADDITVVILGMAIQVAPLAIVPLLLKLGGSVLTRIAGVVNNPSKGMIDRTRKFSQSRYDQSAAAGMRRNRALSEAGKLSGKGNRRNALRRYAVYRDDDRRMREGLQKADEQVGDAMFKQSDNGKVLHEAEYVASNSAERVETALKTEIQNRINMQGSQLHLDNIRLEATKAELAEAGKTTEAMIHEYQTDRSAELRRANGINLGSQEDLAISALSNATRNTAIQNYRDQQASRVINTELAKRLTSSEVLQQEAGGIAEHGADAALASAVSTMRSDYGKNVEDARQIIKHFNLDSAERQAHAMGTEFSKKGPDGTWRTFKLDSTFTREAAIEDQLTTGTVPMIQEIIAESGGSLSEFKTTIADTVAKAGVGNKAQYLGGSTINQIARGDIKSKAHLNGIVQDFIAKGKIKPETVAKMDKDALETLYKAATSTDKSFMSPQDVANFDAGVRSLKQAAEYATTNDELKSFSAENAKPVLEQLRKLP